MTRCARQRPRPSRDRRLLDVDLVFEVQGDDGVLPWIGRRTGRQAIAEFIRDIRSVTEPVTFDVEGILASDSRVAIILTITGDVVTRFQMLEDSFDVSKAARTCSDTCAAAVS
jgi:hypothetical protein